METNKLIYQKDGELLYRYRVVHIADDIHHELYYAEQSPVWGKEKLGKLATMVLETPHGIILKKMGGLTEFCDVYNSALINALSIGECLKGLIVEEVE